MFVLLLKIVIVKILAHNLMSLEKQPLKNLKYISVQSSMKLQKYDFCNVVWCDMKNFYEILIHLLSFYMLMIILL